MNKSRITLLALIAAVACTVVSAQERPDSDQPRGDNRDRRPEERQRVRPADEHAPADGPRDSRDGDRLRPPPPQRGDDQARPDRREDARPAPPRGPRDGFDGPRRFRGPDGEFRPRFHRPMPDIGPLAMRVYHIERAIKHLRAAGLDEMADRLEERLHQAERSFGTPRPTERRDQPAPRPRPEPRRDEEPRERP